MKYVYPAIFRKDELGGYFIFFPDIHMGGTQGNDMIEGMEMAEDFLAAALYMMEREGDEIPIPSDISSLKNLEEGDIVTMVKADVEEYRRIIENRSVKKTLSIPSWLNVKAEQANINFSQTLQRALKDELRITER